MLTATDIDSFSQPTDAEILACIEKRKEDFFGHIASDLIAFVPFHEAKPYLKEGVTESEWTPAARTKGAILLKMQEYMAFAWGKANNCRGLSANRSLQHFAAWAFMLGDMAVYHGLDEMQYYGKPQLRAICERYGWEWKSLDDGHWVNDESQDPVTADQVPAHSFVLVGSN